MSRSGTDERIPPIDTALEHWAQARSPPLGRGFLQARLARERAKAGRLEATDARVLGRSLSPRHLVPRVLALSGLAGHVRRNALSIGLTRRPLELPVLPSAFDGFRLLHVSDPHFGADAALDDAIVACVTGVEHDLCVMTGDYRYRSFGPTDTAIARLAALRETLGTGAAGAEPLAVLGNHDAVGMVPAMESLGIRVLLNEHVTLRRGRAALHVAGIDDPRYYRLDDLARSLGSRVDDGPAATLLLAHSPERADEAAAAGCHAYLCGHTHGGQLCLPGERILMRNARAPLERLSGAWRVGEMRGYTSRGAGVSIATARFNCPPEITLHVLGRSDAAGSPETRHGRPAR